MSKEGHAMGPSIGFLPGGNLWPLPKAMSKEDIENVLREYSHAARLCAQAGFDAIELHAGHGYLLSQFLCPMLNRRTDEYGGSTERRSRFPVEALQRVMESSLLPTIVKMNAEDGFSGGLVLKEAVHLARIFADAGAAGIVPSYGFTSLNGFAMLRGVVPYEKDGCQHELDRCTFDKAFWIGPRAQDRVHVDFFARAS